jgi:hypothetical protein
MDLQVKPDGTRLTIRAGDYWHFAALSPEGLITAGLKGFPVAVARWRLSALK